MPRPGRQDVPTGRSSPGESLSGSSISHSGGSRSECPATLFRDPDRIVDGDEESDEKSTESMAFGLGQQYPTNDEDAVIIAPPGARDVSTTVARDTSTPALCDGSAEVSSEDPHDMSHSAGSDTSCRPPR